MRGQGQVPGDCGEGVHFAGGVAYSTIRDNFIAYNSGGVLLSDDVGPTHNNVVEDNIVTGNSSDCGITVPGHNPNALNSAGVPQPSVAGVYANVIRGNVVTGNGVQGDGAGVLFANAAAGTASYDNLVEGNYIAGNGLAGVTMHAHTLPPGGHEDLNGNVIVGNSIGKNNLDRDTLDGPPGPVTKTTGVLVFSGGTPVTVTVAHNHIFNNVHRDLAQQASHGIRAADQQVPPRIHPHLRGALIGPDMVAGLVSVRHHVCTAVRSATWDAKHPLTEPFATGIVYRQCVLSAGVPGGDGHVRTTDRLEACCATGRGAHRTRRS